MHIYTLYGLRYAVLRVNGVRYEGSGVTAGEALAIAFGKYYNN